MIQQATRRFRQRSRQRFGHPTQFRRLLALGCSGLLGLLTVACQRQQQSVDVPVSNWPGYEYMFLARRLGLDQREGLTINIRQYPDPQVIVHAYLRGELAIAQLTTVEAVDLCARVPARCPVVVLVLDESRGADQIAVVNTLASLRDLRHHRVAVTFSTLGPYVLSRALEQQQLSLRAGQEAVRDAQLRYRAGISPLTELLLAQRNLQLSRSAEAVAIHRWNLSRAGLELETGLTPACTAEAPC